jgi:hypothetical protein
MQGLGQIVAPARHQRKFPTTVIHIVPAADLPAYLDINLLLCYFLKRYKSKKLFSLSESSALSTPLPLTVS